MIVTFIIVVLSAIRDTVNYIKTSKGSELVFIEWLSIGAFISAFIGGAIKWN